MKLVLTFVAAVLLGLLLLALLLLLPLTRQLLDGFGPVRAEQAAQEHAAQVADAITAGHAVGPVAVPPDLPADGQVQVITRDGLVLLDTAGGEGRTLSQGELLGWLAQRAAPGAGLFIMHRLEPDLGYYIMRAPAPAILTAPGTGGQVGLLLLIAIGLTLLVNLGLFAALSLHLERPIRRLSGAIARIAGGDLTARTDLKPRSDELGLLARDLDTMAQRLQEAQERARTAEAAHRYLIAAASHDLRTPLTALLAHAENLRSGAAEDPARSLAVIEERGLQIKRLSDDLFELAALDANRQPWITARTDLAELVRQAVIGALPALEAAGMAVEADLPDGPLWAELAPGKVERVVDNLLTNALKYGAAGGWLGVKLSQKGARLRVEVADRGPGVPELERAMIFSRFYRADGARGRSGGAGLGLAIAREIIARHGGEIGVAEEQGGGARFWFEVES